MADDRSSEHAITTPAFFLFTPRLGFRHWTAADGSLALVLWGDIGVTRLIGGPFSDTDIAARLAHEIAQQETLGVQYWPIFLRDTGEFAGCCGLRPCPPDERTYELGFHVRPSFQGRGLAVEAARAVIAHAFDTLRATRLFAGHHPDNAASARLLQRLGFHYDRHAFYPPTGLDHPSYVLFPHATSA